VAPPVSYNSTLDLDTRLLSNFIYEFNIARRHVSAYPPNHPIIAVSAEKVLKHLRELLSVRDEITLGIAKDTLIIGDSFLDKTNPVYRDVARLLFGHGIAAITFSNSLKEDELVAFYHLLALKREQVEEQGGLLNAIRDNSILGIQIRHIDYSAFRATDEEALDGSNQPLFEKQSALLWENFVRGMLDGTLVQGSDLPGQTIDLDPAVLADMLNQGKRKESSAQSESTSYDSTIASFLQQIDSRERFGQREEMIRRLSSFISRLTPELRRQFLNSTFTNLANRQDLAESVLTRIPEDAILDALDDLSARQGSLPQMMLGLIGKLSGSLEAKTSKLEQHRQHDIDTVLGEKLKIIFQEDSLDKFLPENYQKALSSIIAGENISPAEQSEVEELKESLSGLAIEEQISTIILEIINSSTEGCNAEVMQRNLLDLCSYFLGMGDFPALANIFDRMERQSVEMEGRTCHILDTFVTEEFVEEVLNGLNFWGKSKYQEIGDLIARVGAPFCEPLLDRLAEEQNMSLRRYYMEHLARIGTPARDAALGRLRDSRWYFIRNIILLLRNIEDPVVIPHIRRMTGHPHPKVRQEAIKGLLFFHDPEADTLLLRDLSSSDQETVLNATRLAEQSQNLEVLKRLVEFLRRGGLGAFDLELKITTIHTLGMIGNPVVLPELERLLTTRSFLRSGQLSRLKAETVQSLKHYPRQSVIGLLKELAQSGQDETRRLAEEIYRLLKGDDRAQ
jgi:HEAT repeat protein